MHSWKLSFICFKYVIFLSFCTHLHTYNYSIGIKNMTIINKNEYLHWVELIAYQWRGVIIFVRRSGERLKWVLVYYVDKSLGATHHT